MDEKVNTGRNLLKESTRSLIEADFRQYGRVLEETEKLALDVFTAQEFQEICSSMQHIARNVTSRPAASGEFGTQSQISRTNKGFTF